MAMPKNLFTDIGAAVEEAYFLHGEHGHTHAIIQHGAGTVWVTKKYSAVKGGFRVMWDTTQKNRGVKPCTMGGLLSFATA